MHSIAAFLQILHYSLCMYMCTCMSLILYPVCVIIHHMYMYMYVCVNSLEPTEVTVHSPGARMNESVRDIRCGTDSTVFITEVGRVFACGK